MSLMETRAIEQKMDTIMLDEKALCAFCAKNATKTCGRCGEFYCSPECQLSDWRNHRFICIPLPQLLPLNHSMGEQFSRQSSTRASWTSPARARQMAEKIVAAVPKESGDTKTINDEHDGISNIKASTLSANRERGERTDAAENGNAFYDKMVDSIAKISIHAKSDPWESNILGPMPNRGREEKTLVVENGRAADTSSSSTTHEQAIEMISSRFSRSQFSKSVELVPSNPDAVRLPSDSVVIVVHVKDHRTLYVRQKPVSSEPDQYKQLVQLVNDASMGAERFTSRPTVGEIVLALSHTHSMYGRGTIEQIIGLSALISFFEFGGSEMVDAGNIKVLPDNLRRSSRLLNEITLAGVPTDAMNSEKIVKFLTKLDSDQTPLKLKYTDDKVNEVSPGHISIEGDLIDATTSISINQKVIECNVAAPLISIVSDSVAGYVSADENTVELPNTGFSGTNITVLILDNSLIKMGYVSCIRVADSVVFGENDERINAYGKKVANDPPFSPSVGMVCVVRSAEDRRWYRAQIIHKKDKDVCEIAYIDYGNMESVNVSEIRAMDETLRFPCITVSCYIDGVTWMKRKLSKQLVDRLKRLLPAYEKKTFDAIDYSDEAKTAIGKMHKMVQTLQDEQLI